MIEKTIILTNLQRPATFSNRVRPICLPKQVLQSQNMRSSLRQKASQRLPISFDDQTLPNQLLHQYSLFTTTLSKKIMGQFFLSHSKIPILLLGCGPLWRTSHCGRLGQVTLLLSYIFGVVKSLRVHECKNAPFILLGAEKWAIMFLHAFLYLPDDFGEGKTLF